MLFDEIVFGPVKSRRLGISLGINILPLDNKLCNFNCIYCECGWNRNTDSVKKQFISYGEIVSAMQERFSAIAAAGTIPDAITFAGNGEPTMHPDFAKIMDATVELRDRYLPAVKICVLTNSLLADRKEIRNALRKADRRIMKLDAGNARMFELLDQPNSQNAFGKILELLRSFEGQIEIQTIFFSGEINGTAFDNAAPEEVASWINCLQQIRPERVQLYSIDRATPAEKLQKTSRERLEEIARQVRACGIKADVY